MARRRKNLRGAMQAVRLQRYASTDAVMLYAPSEWLPGEYFDLVEYGATEMALHFHEDGERIATNLQRRTAQMSITKMFPNPMIVKPKATVVPARIEGNYLIFDPTPALESTPTHKLVAAE